jgi:hypothetical protein
MSDVNLIFERLQDPTFYDFMDALLEPLNIPYAAFRYINPPKTYMTYRKYENTPDKAADDKVIERTYYVQVDIWSKTLPAAQEKQVREYLESYGFLSRSSFSDYEDDTGLYREGMRFEYTTNKL